MEMNMIAIIESTDRFDVELQVYTDDSNRPHARLKIEDYDNSRTYYCDEVCGAIVMSALHYCVATRDHAGSGNYARTVNEIIERFVQ